MCPTGTSCTQYWMLRNRLDIQLRNVCLIFRVYGWLQSLWTPWTPFAPSLEPLEYTASRLRSLEDRSAALGSRRCELPGMHSVPKSAVLPYASEFGGLSRRLLNRATPYVAAAGHSPSSAMGQTAVPPTPLHRTSVSRRALSGTLSFRRHVFAGNPHHRRGFPVPQAGPPEKHHEHRFAQHPLSKIQRADVRLLGGYLRQE